MSGKLRVVIGGQAGSESKGRTTGFLTQADVSPEPQMVIRTGGPQAGHIVVGNGPDGPAHHWKLRCVPVAAVTRPDALLAIASGSEVDLDRLAAEVQQLDEYGYNVSERLIVDRAATILHDGHRQREVDAAMNDRQGSTQTGVGAARTDRLMRTADVYGDGPNEAVVRDVAARFLKHGTVTIEASQGCHLDLFRGPYPYTTSTRTTAIDALASAEIVPWAFPDVEFQIWVVARTYPIRVAGNSGPMENETTWEAVGREPELTTVTQRIRRVAQWNPEQVRESVQWCGGAPTVRVSLSHLDYLFEDAAKANAEYELSDDAVSWLWSAESQIDAQIGLVGVAPDKTIIFRGGLL